MKGYQTDEYILSKLEINLFVTKIQNYRNSWIQRMDRDRLPHLIMKYEQCGKRSQRRPLKRLLDC